MKLVVGLGNPGREYALSRHNVGFRVVNHLARKLGIQVKRRKARALLGEGSAGGEPVVLARPQTYMNCSGESVKLLLAQLGVAPQDMVVVYDDLDLPVGRIRIRAGGGAGGHHGMESIIEHIGSQDFPRIRVGIGRPLQSGAAGEDIIGYVLGPFSAEEEPAAEGAIARAAEAVRALLADGLERAMNRYNRDEDQPQPQTDRYHQPQA